MRAPACLVAACTIALSPVLPAAAAATPPTATPTPTPTTPAATPLDAVPGPVVGGRRLGEDGVQRDLPPGVPAPHPPKADAWLVADLNSRDVLVASRAHQPLAPASTLKIFTALALAPRLDPGTVYTADDADAATDGTKVGLVPGSRYTVDDLLHGLLMGSGNDCAHAIGRLSGGQAAAVARMQAQARRLGALDTVVRNTSGLDAPHQVSSAYDLALAGSAAVADPRLERVLRTTVYAFPGKGRRMGHGRKHYQIQNHNRLLRTLPGTTGVKNGFTEAARASFVGSATRGGRSYLVVLMRAKGTSIWPAATGLLEWAFRNGDRAGAVGTLVRPGELPVAAPAATPAAGPARPGHRATGRAGTVPPAPGRRPARLRCGRGRGGDSRRLLVGPQAPPARRRAILGRPATVVGTIRSGGGRGAMADTAQVDDAVPADAPRSRSRAVRRTTAGDEFTVPLPANVTLRLRVQPVAWLLIAVHLIVTGSRLSRAWWWQDDLNLLAIADHRLGSSLWLNYNGHLQPGTFAVAWLIDRIGPLPWWPAATVTLLLVTGCDLAMLALLVRMFGPRPGILVPLGLFCATTLPLMATMWWAAAMQWLPATLALVLALYGHVGYLRTGRRRDALGALAAIAGGLLFFEKPVTAVGVLAAFSILYGTRARWPTRPFRVLLRNPGYWLLHALLAGGFVALYLVRYAVPISNLRPASVGDHLRLVRYMLLDSYLPCLLGGPFRWSPTAGTDPWPLPVTGFAVLTWVLAALVVVGTARSRRGAWRAWVLLAGFLAVAVTLLSRARIGFIGPIIGRDTRYLTDAAAMTAVCLGLALMPMLPGLDRGLDAESQAAPPPRLAGGRRLQPGVLPVLGALAVLALTVGGVVSGERFMEHASANPTKPYFANLTAGLAAARAASRPVYLFTDEVVPETVMVATFGRSRTLQHVTRPLRDRPRFGSWAPAISTVGADGRILPGAVDGSPVTPGTPLCSRRTGRIVIRPAGTVIQWRWKLQLGYLAENATPARLRIGRAAPVGFRFARGLGNVYLDVTSTSSRTIVIDGIDRDTNVCLGSWTLGRRLRPA